MKLRAAALAAALALCACNPQAPKPSPAPSIAASPQASPLSLHITGEGTPAKPMRWVEQEADNRVEYELLADRAESSGPSGRARAAFKNARITFHDRNGSTMTATAPQAIYDQAQNTLTLMGGVTARGANGTLLTCTSLEYDHADRMLHGKGNVVITDPKGFKGTGSSFDSDISLTHYRMQ